MVQVLVAHRFPSKKKHGPFRGWRLAVQRWDQVDHMSSLIKWERHEKRRIQQKQGQEMTRSILYEHCIPNSWLLFWFFWTCGILPSFSPRGKTRTSKWNAVLSATVQPYQRLSLGSIQPGRGLWHVSGGDIPVVGGNTRENPKDSNFGKIGEP